MGQWNVGQRLAMAALAVILLVTAAWWWLALWPVSVGAPRWLLETRYICFGNRPNELPNAGGWMLLIGQPISMLGFLFVVWGGTVASALRVLAASLAGRAAISVATLALISILTLIAVRAAGASSTARADLGLEKSAVATRVNRALPDLSLVDQRGDTLAWSAFGGRIVLLTFAYGHCETVCPLVVRDVLAARARLAASGPGAAVVVVTLDPWRDTPLRLGRIARQWGLGPHDRVLSGEVDQVLDALGKLGVSFTRDPTTGAVTHAPVVYVVDGSGRVDWVTNGGVDLIMELARQSGA